MLCTRINLTKLSSNCRQAWPAIARVQTIAWSSRRAEQRRWLQSNVCGQNRGQAALLAGTRCQYCTAGATTNIVSSQDKQQQQENDGLLKRVLTKVGFTPNSKTRIKVASHILYESVADKINYLNFFHDFNLPNTFNSWFLVTELHVWMLLVRSMAEGAETGENGRFLRNCIVEAMWSDVNTRAKKLGANNSSRTRQQIEVLSEQFQAALIAYDEGVMSDDRVLAASLWRRFFEVNCDDYEKIERLVKYVRKQILMLDRLPREEFLVKPKIPWLDLEKIKV